MWYLDANVFLYGVLYDDARGRRCRALLGRVVRGEQPACTSVLTWDEVGYVVERTNGREDAVLEGERLLRFPHLSFIECGADVLTRAQSLRAETALRPRDCLHAASAIEAGADAFVTEDRDFDALPDLRARRP